MGKKRLAPGKKLFCGAGDVVGRGGTLVQVEGRGEEVGDGASPSTRAEGVTAPPVVLGRRRLRAGLRRWGTEAIGTVSSTD